MILLGIVISKMMLFVRYSVIGDSQSVFTSSLQETCQWFTRNLSLSKGSLPVKSQLKWNSSIASDEGWTVIEKLRRVWQSSEQKVRHSLTSNTDFFTEYYLQTCF